MPKLYEWQQEALKKWIANNKQGIVKAVTGTGKTRFAIATMEEVPDDVIITIIVPTIHLMEQWKENLIKNGFKPSRISMIGGGNKPVFSKINIMVINTARELLRNRSIDGKHFLIVDEVHRSGAEVNSQIFTCEYDFCLGISATPERKDYGFEQFIMKGLGDIIYEYGYEDAVKDEVISDFEVINLGLDMTPQEKIKYDDYTKKIMDTIKKIKQKYPKAMHVKNFDAYLKKLGQSTKDHLFYNYFRYTQKRKRFLYSLPSREDVAMKLIEDNEEKKIIIFHESIELINKMYERLAKKYGSFSIGVYHSKMKKKEKQEVLQKYRDGRYRMILSVKALIEGLDVPDTDMGIVVASSSSVTQRIQSVGRVLRRSSDKDKSLIYTLFVKDTTDTRILRDLNQQKVIPLDKIKTVDFESGQSMIEDFTPQKLVPGEPYPYYYDGVPISMGYDGALFKKHKYGRSYCKESGKYQKLLRLMLRYKPTGGRFKITKNRELLTRVEGTTIFCGWVSEYPQDDEFEPPKDYSKPLTPEENQEMIDRLMGLGR